VTDTHVTVWYNPRCSKCQGAEELLAAHGVPARKIYYLDEPPSRTEIVRVMGLLGTVDPRTMMRINEPVYDDLGLASATAEELIDAMATHPQLIERPIVIRADRAVVARPPERLLELLDER
jgi:arsenate reductase